MINYFLTANKEIFKRKYSTANSYKSSKTIDNI